MWTAFPVLVLALASSAHAVIPPTCDSGTLRKATVTANRFTLDARLTTAAALDPVANGLELSLTASPGGALLDAAIPAGAFQQKGRGFRYRDPSGAVGGIVKVRIGAGRKGVRTITVRGKGALDVGAGTLRVAIASGGACTRTCGAPCALKRGRLRCKRSAETPTCGLDVAADCEVLNLTPGAALRSCMLPYPSDFFLADDASTPTGKAIAYTTGAMPRNAGGTPIDPTPYHSLDGFSPSTTGILHWPQGVDLDASKVPPNTDFAASLEPASPTVIIEADAPGCQRVVHFGENDVSADQGGAPVAPPDQVFMLRPGVRLKNATRYVVAVRGLIGQDGAPIQASPAFAALRDGVETELPAVESRRARFEQIFTKLEADCGMPRNELQIAWDFTTASDDAITRWLVEMRDVTFAQLGANAPAFVVSSVEDDPFDGDGRVCRRVRGTYSVPLFTTFNGPGSLLNVDPATNLPVQNGVADDVPFTVMIPCSVWNGPTPGRPIYYGHGLLGSGDGEVTAGNLRTLADTYGFVIGATDWQGFSEHDVPTIIGFIPDLSGFPKLAERLHQGVLNQLVMGRLMQAANGLRAHPAFQRDATPLIGGDDVYYYGNSQGGIEGGVVMALSQDATRGVLGVPGANYSLLLHRSRDFEPFFAIMRPSYPDPLERILAGALIQQLWDRSEPSGWYHHTLPGTVPNTPPHDVLVHMATADDEVSNLATEIMVRSMGMPQVAPVVRSYFGIDELAAPFDGSAMVESDGGYPPIPTTNVPPADNDAHGQMRGRPAIQAQIDAFLRPDGGVQNFCSGHCDPE